MLGVSILTLNVGCKYISSLDYYLHDNEENTATILT